MAGTSLCLEGAPERGLAGGDWCIIPEEIRCHYRSSGALMFAIATSFASSEGLGYLPQVAQLLSRTYWTEALLLTFPQHFLLSGPPSFSHGAFHGSLFQDLFPDCLPSPVGPRALDPLCCPDSHSHQASCPHCPAFSLMAPVRLHVPPSWGSGFYVLPGSPWLRDTLAFTCVHEHVGNGRKLSILFPEKHTDTKRWGTIPEGRT